MVAGLVHNGAGGTSYLTSTTMMRLSQRVTGIPRPGSLKACLIAAAIAASSCSSRSCFLFWCDRRIRRYRAKMLQPAPSIWVAGTVLQVAPSLGGVSLHSLQKDVLHSCLVMLRLQTRVARGGHLIAPGMIFSPGEAVGGTQNEFRRVGAHIVGLVYLRPLSQPGFPLLS